MSWQFRQFRSAQLLTSGFFFPLCCYASSQASNKPSFVRDDEPITFAPSSVKIIPNKQRFDLTVLCSFFFSSRAADEEIHIHPHSTWTEIDIDPSLLWRVNGTVYTQQIKSVETYKKKNLRPFFFPLFKIHNSSPSSPTFWSKTWPKGVHIHLHVPDWRYHFMIQRHETSAKHTIQHRAGRQILHNIYWTVIALFYPKKMHAWGRSILRPGPTYEQKLGHPIVLFLKTDTTTVLLISYVRSEQHLPVPTCMHVVPHPNHRCHMDPIIAYTS